LVVGTSEYQTLLILSNSIVKKKNLNKEKGKVKRTHILVDMILNT